MKSSYPVSYRIRSLLNTQEKFMISTDYYDILLQGIDSRCTVSRLVHGVSWTAAVLSDGSCGVAMHSGRRQKHWTAWTSPGSGSG